MRNCGNCIHLEGWGDDEQCSLAHCVHDSKELLWLFEHNIPLIKHSLPKYFFVKNYDIKDPVMQKFVILIKCWTSSLCRVLESPGKVRIELYDPNLGRLKGKPVKEIPSGVISLEELYENMRAMKYYNPASGAVAGAAAGIARAKSDKKVRKNILKGRVKA